jgi:hypothetical protein
VCVTHSSEWCKVEFKPPLLTGNICSNIDCILRQYICSIASIDSIDRLGFIMETICVLCMVGTTYLYIILINVNLQQSGTGICSCRTNSLFFLSVLLPIVTSLGFFFMLLLPEYGGEVWEPSNKEVLFHKSGALERKVSLQRVQYYG